MKQRVKQGCLAILTDRMPDATVRASTLPDKNGRYRKACTMSRSDIAMVMHVQVDGDCFIITKNGTGWVMNAALQALK